MRKRSRRISGKRTREPRFLAYDPGAQPQILTERFNAAPVMPPAEVEQLMFDLLADLAPADARPESAKATGQFVGIMIEFCHDWRSLWSLFGDAPDNRGPYEQLLAATRKRIAQLPPVRIASTGYSAQAVLQARVLAHVFGDGGGPRREAAEFNASPVAPAAAPIVATIVAQASPTAELPTLELPQVELPTVEVPRIEESTAKARAAEPEPTRVSRRRNPSSRRCWSGRSSS